LEKLNSWPGAVAISGAAIIGFLCGTLYGKQFYGIQWETILAGFLGVCGGALAIVAVRWQDKVQQLRVIEACERDIRHLKTMTTGALVKRDNAINELGSALEILARFERTGEFDPNEEHRALLAHTNVPADIKSLTDDLATLQSASNQITIDFRTLITLMNRTGLKRRMMALPVATYRQHCDTIDTFPNAYFSRTSLEEGRNMIREQLSLMHTMLRNTMLGDATPAGWHMDSIIEKLQEQRNNL
tara:strand:+ start:59 stop:790 length:732 start_codon:yes stop_codon:yes gene_type:complete